MYRLIVFPLLLTLLFSCAENKERVKFQRYMVAGQRLYEKKCANCHQVNGEGLRDLFPPLKNADFLRENMAQSICIIKNGADEPMVINGKTYRMKMPASELSNLEIAEISTYIYNSWGLEKGLIDVKKVDSIVYKCN